MRLGPRVFSLAVFPLDLLTGNKVFVSPIVYRGAGPKHHLRLEHLIFSQRCILNSMCARSGVAELFGGFDSLNV